MFVKNFFENANFTSLLPKGNYTVKLINLRNGKTRDFGDGNPPRDTLTFCFQTPEGVSVNRTVTATPNPRGKLIEFVRQMTGETPSSEVLKDGESFSSFLCSLIGKSYRVNVEPSANGKYNNITSIAKMEVQ